jgi:hypothetical protein
MKSLGHWNINKENSALIFNCEIREGHRTDNVSGKHRWQFSFVTYGRFYQSRRPDPEKLRFNSKGRVQHYLWPDI